MKKKELDSAIETDTSLVSEKVKDTPIVLPDGVAVKLGMTIYSVMDCSVSSYSGDVKSYSGKARSKIIENTVIGVNQSANARTFTARSDRGCETTYSVRNNCLPQIFGKRSSAAARAKEVVLKDIAAIEAKAKFAKENLEKYNRTITQLKSAKF